MSDANSLAVRLLQQLTLNINKLEDRMNVKFQSLELTLNTHIKSYNKHLKRQIVFERSTKQFLEKIALALQEQKNKRTYELDLPCKTENEFNELTILLSSNKDAYKNVYKRIQNLHNSDIDYSEDYPSFIHFSLASVLSMDVIESLNDLNIIKQSIVMKIIRGKNLKYCNCINMY